MPVTHSPAFGALLYSLSILLFAVMDTIAKHLTGAYPTAQIVFFRSLFGCLTLLPLFWRARGSGRSAAPNRNITMVLAGALGLAWGWHPPTLTDLALFAAMGLLGGSANYLGSLAYQRCTLSTVAPLEYLLIWAMLFGYAFWREIPSAWMLAGAGLIVAANLVLTLSGKRQ
ncbi:MAG TPA: hypothetical protein VNN09_03390 [Candidatus Competibacteraceae bacterium]|nr:hypothetical protein [Candidatus Competibacteraceae bacterium]